MLSSHLPLQSVFVSVHVHYDRVERLGRHSSAPWTCLVFMFGSGRDLVKGGVLRMTGGGAMKYAKLFTEQLGVSLQRTDEIDSIMAGLVLLASHTNSVFRFDLNTRQRVPVDVVRSLTKSPSQPLALESLLR